MSSSSYTYACLCVCVCVCVCVLLYTQWNDLQNRVQIYPKDRPWEYTVHMCACMLSHFICIQFFAIPCQPGSSVQRICLSRILEWAAMLSSRGSSPPRDPTLISCVSCTAGGFFMAEPPGKPFLKLCSIPYCEYTIIQHLKLTSSTTIYVLHIYMFLFLPVCFLDRSLKVECRLRR